MSNNNAQTQTQNNTSEEVKQMGYYQRSSSAFKAKIHCPICGGIANKFATSYYCENCDIDIDENGKIIY